MSDRTLDKKRHAERRRDAIIEAAVRLFCEKGYEGTTIRDIAHQVGVTEGLLYHYFPSKSALIGECWRQREWHAQAVAVVREAGGRHVAEVLRRLITENLAVMYQNGAAFRMHAAELLRDGELAALSQRDNDETHEVVARYLRRQQETGHIRADLDPQIVAGTILGTTITFFVVHGRLPEREWHPLAARMADDFTRLLMHGLSGRHDAEEALSEEDPQ
jgi:AcrR family transcriptional regulator